MGGFDRAKIVGNPLEGFDLEMLTRLVRLDSNLKIRAKVQVSLRTTCRFRALPGVETPGYCQRSLRDRGFTKITLVWRGYQSKA